MKKKKSKLSLSKFLGGLATLLTISYFGIYFYATSEMNPDLVLRLQGHHPNSEPIIPRTDGIYTFALSTNQSREVILQNLEVHYNPNSSIDISPIDSEDIFHFGISDIKDFDFKLVFDGELKVSHKIAQSFAFAYSVIDTTKPIRLFIRTRAQIAEWDWGFPLNLFSRGPIVKEFPIECRFVDISNFSAEKRNDLESLFVLPMESMNQNGSLNKYSNKIIMRALHGKVPVKIRALYK